MQNDQGKVVDLYIPRKCSATNRVINAKDHASVQISVGLLDSEGRLTGEQVNYSLAGFLRKKGEADSSLNNLLHASGALSFAA
jgi:small subunit ribosomal protein S21e